jgi:hypothetical protein
MPSIKVNLPEPPEGWEYTGEYRRPAKGEGWLGIHGNSFDTSGGVAPLGCFFILKPVKWRAEQGEMFYLVTNRMTVTSTTDIRTKSDNVQYESGNYFRTEKEAENAASAIKELLKQLN